jgi:hypothetical protein
MQKLIYLFVCFIVIVSCGGSSQEVESTSEEVEVDTTAIDTANVDTLIIEENPDRISIDAAALLAKAETVYDLPLIIDSAFISSWRSEGGEEAESEITNAEAQYLSFDFVENDPTSMAEYDVKTFINLDSLKIKGEYEDYQASLDLGQARYSVAMVVGKTSVNQNQTMLIWATDYATYEACPYGYGTCVFGTLFTGNVAHNTVLLGEISGGADAPYWGSTLVTSEVTATAITTKKIQENGGDEVDPETGEEIIERGEDDFRLSILSDGFAVDID